MKLGSCPKAYSLDQDKAAPPAETVARVKAVLGERLDGVLAETRRVDTGRLDIPVFLSVCGPRARDVMPTRKQMGKGATPDQAEASALMELVERFSFFSFFANENTFARLTYSKARERWPGQVPGPEEMLKSVDEDMAPESAARVLDLVRWRFCPALDLAHGREARLPVDLFKKLNEFNGSSAGNTYEESILQGGCELVERHVSAVVDKARPALPTIDQASVSDPTALDLMAKFARNGVKVLLKDFTLDLPAPSVGVAAYDPATFPHSSEIVFTAGTATSPAKALCRALTEVAQLAGDFETGRVYEASGLPKFTDLSQLSWLEAGPRTPLDGLPSILDPDIGAELSGLASGLKADGFFLYSVDITHPDLGVSANYNIVPGFRFRERAQGSSLGLFVGRILAEEASVTRATAGLAALADIYPDAHFLPFFEGLLALRAGDPALAAEMFTDSERDQPTDQDLALAVFYRAYAMSQMEQWADIVPILARAVNLDPEVKEYFNLRGVALFKLGRYQEAAGDFQAALNLDSGSAADMANLGLCHKFLGERDKAVHYLHSALELDPGLEYAATHLRQLLEDA